MNRFYLYAMRFVSGLYAFFENNELLEAPVRKPVSLAKLPFILTFVFLLSFTVRAQQSALTCTNVPGATTRWVQGLPNNFTLSVEASADGGILNYWESGGLSGSNIPDNVIDNAANKRATLHRTGSNAGRLRVKDPDQTYSAGNFVGFKIGGGGLVNLFASVTIRTFLNGVPKDSYSSTNLISILPDITNDIYTLGFNTTKDFNEVEIEFGGTAVLGTSDVYNAVIQSYCAASAPLACNTKTPIVAPAYPVVINPANTGVTGVNLLTLSGVENIVDANTTNSAVLTRIANVGEASVAIAVRDVVSDYDAGTFAGFDISKSTVLGIGLLDRITINTYKDGSNTAVETMTGSSLRASASLLTATGRQTVGFVTKESFDEIQIVFNQATGVDLGVIEIYNAVFRKFCENPTELACNTVTTLKEADYPIYVNALFSGVTGTIGVNNQIENIDRLLDENSSNYASIVLPAGVASGTIAVRKEGVNFPTGSLVGFDIARPVLASVGVLDGITISTFLDGEPSGDYPVSGTNLVSVNSSILSGSGTREIVGFIPTQPYNEVRMTVTQTGVTLGTTNVYGFVIQKFCEYTGALDCNTIANVTNTTHPVYINGKNTGVDAVACVGCSINDAQHVVDSDQSNYASIILTTGVVTTASFSVANALQTYNEVGGNYEGVRYAGFDIATSSLLSASVLSSSVTLSLYNNGVLVPGQTFTGTDLLVGVTTSLLVDGFNKRSIGIIASAGTQFDEVKISFSQPVNANLGTIRIYNSFVSKACAGTVACNNTYVLSRAAFPAYIDWDKTGTSGTVATLYGVQDAENVVSANENDYAVIKLDVGVMSAGSIAVKDIISNYPIGTTVGFRIQTLGAVPLADLQLLTGITLTTYYEGQVRDVRTGSELLNLNVLGLVQIGVGDNRYNIGFKSTQPFDEVRITIGGVAGVNPLFGETRVFGAFIDTRTSMGGNLVCNILTNPDFNVTYPNINTTGDVSTNDDVPVNSTYGTAVAVTGNPNATIPVISADGTYTFNTNTPGVYVYQVPVCLPAPQTGCVNETLTITVLSPNTSTNPPVANVDIASVKGSPTDPGSVTVDVRANDGAGNIGGTLDTPTIPNQPVTGTATIDANGNLQYTPAPGFYGEVIVTYSVCESPSGKCRTADVVITVLEPATPNSLSASDDYNSTRMGTKLTVSAADGVLVNDNDPDGDALTVTAQNTTIANVGTLVLAVDGSYVFTPVAGYSGPASFIYEVCDGMSLCRNATLYILVVSDSALPVTLTKFSAVKEGILAQLSWSTTFETNSENFDVQRSVDGKTWNSIGNKPAKGESSSTVNYFFTDNAPREGENLYRLKMTDRDGTFAYSRIESLNFRLELSTKLYPNPVSGSEKLVIEIEDWSKVKSVRIVSSIGKTMFESSHLIETGIKTENFTSGVYFVQITQKDGKTDFHKFVKF